MNNESVSIVIPAFNASETICQTLESIRLQSKLPDEVWVVDDGSSDDTVNLVEKYINKHGLQNWSLLRQANAGPAAARDNGIRRSNSILIALLDADDQWEVGRLEYALAVMSERGFDLVGSGVNSGNQLPRCWMVQKWSMLLRNPYFTSTVLFRKNAYLRVGGFDLSQRYSEDYRLWLDFAWNGMRCGLLSPSMAHYNPLLVGPHRGLSSRRKEMLEFEMKNFRDLYQKGCIPLGVSWCAQAFSLLKFLKRNVF